MKRIYLVLTFCAFILGSSVVYSQIQQVDPPAEGTALQEAPADGQAPAPVVKKTFPFNQYMARASKEHGWSKLYFESFKRSREAKYIQLSGSHARNSIQILYEAQTNLPRTNRFHYVARSKRLVACSYYGMLREASMSLPQSQNLSSVSGKLCQQF